MGLTGSTGAGKGEVARLMAARSGWRIIDADVISRRVVEVGRPTLTALVQAFSDEILQENGSLNRKKLAEIAFSSPEKTALLNAIVHPAVTEEICCELRQADDEGIRVAVIDAPLLFQAGVDALCDYTVAVTAPASVRCERICARDGLTVAEAERRMGAQPTDDFYLTRVHYVIENSGELAALSRSVERICETIEGVLA